MMRAALLAVGTFLLVATVRADDASAIVDKAVEATATSSLRLHRLSNVVRTDRGTLFMPDGEWTAERVATYALPDRLKYVAMLTVAGQRRPTIMALNGPLGWQQSGGEVQNLSPPQADALRDGDLDGWSLLTLLAPRERGAKLQTLPAMTINGKQAVGVCLTRPGRQDAQLYFDAATRLPLRVTHKVRESAVETRQEDLDAYKDFDGIRLPTHITVFLNGRKAEDWTVQSYRFPDRLDGKIFVKP
jgi:hypothetical protein